jgi:hypothetical protein
LAQRLDYGRQVALLDPVAGCGMGRQQQYGPVLFDRGEHERTQVCFEGGLVDAAGQQVQSTMP